MPSESAQAFSTSGSTDTTATNDELKLSPEIWRRMRWGKNKANTIQNNLRKFVFLYHI